MSMVEKKTLELAELANDCVANVITEMTSESAEYTSYDEVFEPLMRFLDAYDTYISMRDFEAKYKCELERNDELEKKNAELKETLKQMQEEINKLTAPVPKVATIGQIG